MSAKAIDELPYRGQRGDSLSNESLLDDLASDEALMAGYQDGDEGAFEEIYARYANSIYKFFLRRLGQPAVCAELFQETFLRVHKARHSFRTEMSFKTWLYAIASNLMRDTLKSKSWSKTVQLSDKGESFLQKAIPSGGHKLLSFKEAFATLTEDQKEAIILSRFQGLKYEEIAKIMGRSADAVNQLIQRALFHLRKMTDES